MGWVGLILQIVFVSIGARAESTESFEGVLRQLERSNGLAAPECVAAEPQVCTDPVEAVCGPDPRHEKGEAAARRSLDAIKRTLPGKLAEPKYFKKLGQEYVAISNEVVRARESAKSDAALARLDRDPRFKKLNERADQILRERNDYRVQLDQAVMKALAEKGIDLERDFFNPLKTRMQKFVVTSPTFRSGPLTQAEVSKLNEETSRPSPNPTEKPGLARPRVEIAVADETARPGSVYLRSPVRFQPRTFGPAESAMVVGAATLANGKLAKDYAQQPTFMASIADACDEGGVNAFLKIRTQKPSFYLCPGALALLLEPGYTETLIFFAAHELGHSIDGDQAFINFTVEPVRNFSLKEHEETEIRLKKIQARLILNERYEPFLECIRKHQLPYLTRAAQLPAYLREQVIPELETKGDRGMIKMYREFAEQCEKDLPLLPAAAPNSYCAGNPIIRLFDKELIADSFADELLIPRLKPMSLEQRLSTVQNVFRFACADRTGMTLHHPPARIRIGNIFNQPEVRRLFGCRSPAKQPYCTIQSGGTASGLPAGSTTH